MGYQPEITVITPTIPMRQNIVPFCEASVSAQSYPVNHYVEVDTEGVGPAVMRNNMARKVDTDWIAFLDDDDTLHSNYFETIVPFLADYDVVYSWGDGLADVFQVPFDGKLLECHNTIPVTAVVSRDLFIQHDGFPCDVLYEDWSLWLKLYEAGARFKCVEQVLWTYNDHAYGRLTYKNNRLRSSGLIRAK